VVDRGKVRSGMLEGRPRLVLLDVVEGGIVGENRAV
jgi:hypothetical protein